MNLTKVWSNKESLSPAYEMVTFYQGNKLHTREKAQRHAVKTCPKLNRADVDSLCPSQDKITLS